jgi:hypothetical protein
LKAGARTNFHFVDEDALFARVLPPVHPIQIFKMSPLASLCGPKTLPFLYLFFTEIRFAGGKAYRLQNPPRSPSQEGILNSGARPAKWTGRWGQRALPWSQNWTVSVPFRPVFSGVQFGGQQTDGLPSLPPDGFPSIWPSALRKAMHRMTRKDSAFKEPPTTLQTMVVWTGN